MMASQLDIRVELDEKLGVTSLTGPVDSATFGQFRETMEPLSHRAGFKLVVDASRLSYINSRGIALLAAMHRALMAQMGNLVLCGINERIARTIDLLGLAKRIRVFETREEALAFFE